jgi:hypothetical protein
MGRLQAKKPAKPKAVPKPKAVVKAKPKPKPKALPKPKAKPQPKAKPRAKPQRKVAVQHLTAAAAPSWPSGWQNEKAQACDAHGRLYECDEDGWPLEPLQYKAPMPPATPTSPGCPQS